MAGNWQQDLREFAELFEGADLTEAFRAADDVLSEGFQQNFFNAVDEKGIPWPPHAPATVARYGPHDLLILTGRMFAAATNPDDPGHLMRVEDNSALVTGIKDSVVPHAKFHHTGTVKMPRRRVIYATPETINRARDAFAEKAEEAILR